MYYSLLYNKERDGNAVTRRFGLDWIKKYKFNPNKLSQLVVEQLRSQLASSETNPNIEIVKAVIFTSTKNDTFVGGSRDEFINIFRNNPLFDLQL